MAYLGHKPAVGENNSFRILDDISSFVLTFDGSSASAVGLSDETITITENNHRFITGQRVTYSNGGGGNITGLTNGQAYFVINHSSTQIKLASSASNALAGTAVNLTGLGTGSSHTLTLAFDGVNTKFVPTFGDGMHDTLIKRAAQLVISINGVIQQPHDTATPSTGFGVDSLGNLIFSTAPASTDAFWAHVLATNTVTFDSSDNDVDTFTGNGSTTSFTLSKIPPDNRNILVTIDGVVQYPSDAANTRSYNLSENVMTFVAAPGLGTVIQVRHIGYAGPAAGGGGGVTGFYGRTGNVSLIATDNILANDATFSGNVSIAKTLTYEDVTDIDSVGLITARSGIKDSTLTAGHVVFAGTAGRLSGEANLFYDSSNDRLGIGTNIIPEKLRIRDAGATGTTVRSNTIADFRSNASNGDAHIRLSNGVDHSIDLGVIGDADFYTTHDGVERFRVTGNGEVGIGTDNPAGRLHIWSTGPDILLTDSNQAADNRNWILTGANTQILRLQAQNDSYAGGGNLFDFYRSGNNINELRGMNAGNYWLTINNSTKKVGVGTDNPDHNLHVFQNAGDSVISIESTGNGNDSALEFIRTSSGGNSMGAGSIYVTGNTGGSEAKMQFGVGHNISHGTLPRMTIMGNGEVGIGTDNPNHELTVYGDEPNFRLTHTGSTNQYNALYTHVDGTGVEFNSYQDGTGTRRPFIFKQYTTEVLRISSTGKLEIQGTRAGSLQANDDDALKLFTKSTTDDIDRGAGITFYTHDGSGFEMGGTIQVAKENGTTNDAKSYMRFSTQSGSTTTERLRIHSGGQISSGVNNNSYEFTIGGLSGGPTLWLRDSGTSGTPRILFGSTAAASIGVLSYNNSSNHMEFHTNGTEKLRIETVSSRGRFNFGAGNSDFTNPDIGGSTSGVSINKNTLGQVYACTDNADNTAANDYQTVVLNVSRRNTSGDGPQIALDRGGWIKASIAGLQGSNTATGGPGSFAVYTHNYNSGQNVRTERLRIAGSDGTVTVGDGNNLAADYVATMLIDGGAHTKLTLIGSTTGTGSVTFSDGSGSGATRRAGFIDFTHGADTTTNQFGIGLADVNKVFIRTAGSNRGSLEVYGSFNESTTPAIEINHGNDARKVFLTNSSGDFNALTRNGSQTKGQLKMFESGILLHNMKNPDATSTLQTFRTGVYKTASGSTNTSVSPIVNYLQKGGGNIYDAFEEGNCELEVNGGGNDHYQPIGFVPRGYDLDQTSFGGQWAGEMWIHQTSSQNPTSYGYSGYNTWATMSFKCRWDCAHWNAKPNGFWVEHYINQGRAQIAKIDASTTQSQFVIYLLPGVYKIRFNCVRGMAVHRAVSDGAALVMRDGGSMVTYNTLAYSSRNTNFDSEISPGSASFAHCT